MQKVSLLYFLLLSPCSLPFQQSQPDGYMVQDSTGVYWAQWTESNGQLTGTFDTYALNSSTHKYESLSFPITGTHNGSNINITIDASIVKLPASGTLDNNTLTLKVQQSGQTKSRSFTGSSNDDYQKTLSDFKAKHPWNHRPLTGYNLNSI